MRAFIAVEIPEAVREGLAAVAARLEGAGVDARWSRPDGVHLTLKFLGDVGEERVPEILQALACSLGETKRFRLGAEGVGTFPNPASARVVWLGITGDVGQLVALQAAVEQAMVGLGLEPDGRAYTPHLTLGRIRSIRRRGAWLKGLEAVRGSRLPGFEVASVSLISSELKPSGAVYRELGKVSFKREPE
jgi:2'-5' RNA ligase